MSKKNKKAVTTTCYPKMVKGETPVRIRHNRSMIPEFVRICKMSQADLKKWLYKKLISFGYDQIVAGDGFIYAKGTIPVLLTAHMDTVHMQSVRTYMEAEYKNGTHRLSSAQGIGGDDRCGIYMILQIIKEHKCSVLFCEDEEIGGIGSQKFIRTPHINELDVNYMIELDRCGDKDAVFYDCDNEEFTNFILSNTSYQEEYGSFSDISFLAPATKIAAVNLSCGYYNAHTTKEYVVIEEMLNTINIVKELISAPCDDPFEYVESIYACNYYNTINYFDARLEKTLEVTYLEKSTNRERTDYICGNSENECWLTFFRRNETIEFNDVLDYHIYDWD